jgi:hypothetical protein
MLDDLLVNRFWTGPALWALLFFSDAALTVACAKYLRSGADSHFVFQVFELTPLFQKDVARLRRYGLRFLFVLVLGTLLLVADWFLMQAVSDEVPWALNSYRAILGMLLLSQVAIHFRHCRNVVLLRGARDSRGVSGKICFAGWFSYQQSAVDLALFAVLFLLSFFLTWNWIFAGGACGCVAMAIKHWRLCKGYYAKYGEGVPASVLGGAETAAIESELPEATGQ